MYESFISIKKISEDNRDDRLKTWSEWTNIAKDFIHYLQLHKNGFQMEIIFCDYYW